MLEKFLNKKVFISFANFAVVPAARIGESIRSRQGTVTAIDKDFIELDNNEVISMKCVATIKTL